MGVPIIKMATIGILPSFLKKIYYKLYGAKIGKNVSIGLLSIIDSETIEIGDDTKIGPLTFIKVKSIKLGKRVKINMMVAIDTGNLIIDNDSTVMEQVVIGGMLTPRSELTIGKRVKIFPYSFINPTEPIHIGDDVGIGGGNYIFTHGSWQSALDGFPVSFGPVNIEKGVWFPWRVFVMPNVTVGEYSTIGAGSIITKNIPARSLAAGSPAKVLRTGNEYVRNLTDDDKEKMVKEILSQFIEYENYKGLNASLIEEDPFRIKITGYSKDYIINFRSNQTAIVDNEVLVALLPITPEVRAKLIETKMIWFDIGGKATFYHKEQLWSDLRDFFSRWGIRFEVES